MQEIETGNCKACGVAALAVIKVSIDKIHSTKTTRFRCENCGAAKSTRRQMTFEEASTHELTDEDMQLSRYDDAARRVKNWLQSGQKLVKRRNAIIWDLKDQATGKTIRIFNGEGIIDYAQELGRQNYDGYL